ncbi:MAG: hypothetical protein LW892_01795, partial [Betaproteobacteria bacterium]|nr:hypothetical protein [Betaproteobacteria bacterium]
MLAVLSLAPHIADAAEERIAGLYTGEVDVGIAAELAGAPGAMPAKRLPCAGCHGLDGAGGSEGTTRVPPIRIENLTTATVTRPAYTAQTLLSALRNGRDPSGRVFDKAMPRYRLADQDGAVMFAFLEQLSERERQGADRGAIRFGIAATGLTPAMRANLAEGMRAAWRNRGDPRLHGREVLFVAGDAPVFAQLFAHRHPASPWATDLPKGGEPIELFPLRGAVSGQRMRGLQPDDRAQIRALIEAAGTDAAIVAVDHMAMFLQAHRLAEKTTRSVPTGT